MQIKGICEAISSVKPFWILGSAILWIQYWASCRKVRNSSIHKKCVREPDWGAKWRSHLSLTQKWWDNWKHCTETSLLWANGRLFTLQSFLDESAVKKGQHDFCKNNMPQYTRKEALSEKSQKERPFRMIY